MLYRRELGTQKRFSSHFQFSMITNRPQPAMSMKDNNDDVSSPTTVSVIGCGPSGMFFLHALETQRRKLEEKKDVVGLQSLPIVTCFEKAPAPGGVWRAERDFHRGEPAAPPHHQVEEKKTDTEHKENKATTRTTSSEEQANMYEALWTNGAKENTEFFDYTYDDHFGHRLPVHLPRRAVLDYMMARVTRNTPNLFEKYVQFNTSVESVTYSDISSKFVVVTRNVLTGNVCENSYDKCIWAAGDNGKPFMPKPLVSLFEKFDGSVIHSSDARDLKEKVSGKRVLMVGGSYSAEDLALMSIKLGVEHIFISHREEGAHVTSTSWWPGNKVTILSEQMPVAITEGGHCIEFSNVEYDYDTCKFNVSDDKIESKLRDIDTVIFCTGYEENMTMLEKSLLPPENPTKTDNFSVPKDWKMSWNELTEEVGDVPVGNVQFNTHRNYVRPGMYRGVLISNPSMMFCSIADAEEPLLKCDADAWLCLAHITDKAKLPTKEEMIQRNHDEFLKELDIPSRRFYLDKNYREALEALGDDHWSDDTNDERYHAMEWKCWQHPWLLVARSMKEGNYPVDLGNYDDGTLSNVGEQMYAMNWKDGELRQFPDAKSADECEWRTFRDYYVDFAEKNFASVFTGTKATPLKKRWMDIDENADCDSI